MNSKNVLKVICLVFLSIVNVKNIRAQNKVKIGVVSMDTRGLTVNNESMTNMVHLELEKLNMYEVLDRYDVADIVKSKGINVNECFGKSCLVRVGEQLQADKMLSGSIEKFGNKIIFILRLVDVKKDIIEKTDVVEYIDQQDQLQIMVRMSLNNIVGVANDKYLMDLLVNFDLPITSSRTTLKLNGPRVGMSYATGKIGERLQASPSEGGFDTYPFSSMLGYQFEKQFLSSGDFQALFEILPAINGLETGKINPSLTTMLGFRFNESGFELGMGPVFRITRTAKGFYQDGEWLLANQAPEDLTGITFEERLDSRGQFRPTSGMIVAVGKTFRSGYLNVPVNIYWNPRKEGHVVGLTVGFNVASTPKLGKN